MKKAKIRNPKTRQVSSQLINHTIDAVLKRLQMPKVQRNKTLRLQQVNEAVVAATLVKKLSNMITRTLLLKILRVKRFRSRSLPEVRAKLHPKKIRSTKTMKRKARSQVRMKLMAAISRTHRTIRWTRLESGMSTASYARTVEMSFAVMGAPMSLI